MEKATVKSKNKILNLLPKVAQASVSFQNPPPLSPGRARWPDLNLNKLRTRSSKGTSGQIASMIPAQARRNHKNSDQTQDPASPKVSCISCMGQIKHRKNRQASLPKDFDFRPVSVPGPEKSNKTRPHCLVPEPKKKPSGILNVFSARRKSDASRDQAEPPVPVGAPSLGQMRRFSSGRDALANFDWTNARIAPEEDPGFHSDDDGVEYSDEEQDVVVSVSNKLSRLGFVLKSRRETA